MTYPGAVAVAAALYARDISPPSRPRGYYPLWFGKVRGEKECLLGEVLRKYGVNVDVFTYTTVVKGKKYARCKVVVRDKKTISRVSRLFANRAELIRAMKRFENIVVEVFGAIGRMRWRAVDNLVSEFPKSRLRKWFGVKPYKHRIYEQWRRRSIMKWIVIRYRARGFWASMYAYYLGMSEFDKEAALEKFRRFVQRYR